MLRSPHPHARVRAIDLSKARALPGVKAIVTHENCDVVWGAGSISGGASRMRRKLASASANDKRTRLRKTDS